MTLKQERLALELTRQPSAAAAGRAAGYSPVAFNRSWYERLHRDIRPITLAALAKHGKVTLPSVSKAYGDALGATKVLAVELLGAKEGGPEKELVTVPDHGTRLEVCRDYMKILGPLGRVAGDLPAEGEMGTVVNILVQHAPMKDVRATKDTVTVKVPKADGRGR